MCENVEKYRDLLSRFLSLPKGNTNPTFMDICRMGGDRFEERCSQVLRFYFSSKEPHNLRDLFFSSLMSLLPKDDDFIYRCPNEVTVVTEEHTENGKRIDLVVIADDMVIAIENKINAGLYNDIADYRSHIENNYRDKNKMRFVVLSVRNITDSRELSKIKDNGYVYINYRDFFSEIKNRLGLYAMNGDSAYITFLFDFIRTIENKYYYANMELKEFFANNQSDIEGLIYEYNKYKGDVLSQQIDRIAELRNLVSQTTGRDWWAWKGWDLGVSFNDNVDGKKIGIESCFEANGTNPTAIFRIHITVWDKKCFEPYRQYLEEKYKGCWIDENGVPNRVYLHLPVVDGNDTEKIIEALTECYNYLNTLTQKIG